MLEDSRADTPNRRRFGDRSLAAAGLAVVVGALVMTHSPTAAASSPTLQVHTTSGGVVVDSPTVSVTGTGKVMGTPDTLTVSLACTSTATHASDALANNNALTAKLVMTLVTAGTTPKDIATSNLNIQPTYSNSGRDITGYTVTENVTVTLHDLGKAGSILDAAASSVGDAVRVNGMSLSISDDSALIAAARKQAVADAKARADEIATGAGVTLGSIRTMSEASAPTIWNTPSASGDLASSAAAVPVAPGQQQLSVSVSVVYTLNT